MLRVVIAVSIALAIVGLAYPAIDDARTVRTERAVRRELAAVVEAVTELVGDETAVPLGDRGARRAVSMRLPRPSLTSASIEYVAIGGTPDDRSVRDTAAEDVIAYKVEGGRRRLLRVDADLRIAERRDGDWHVRDDSDPLVLRGGGTPELTFALAEYRGDETVLVTGQAEL